MPIGRASDSAPDSRSSPAAKASGRKPSWRSAALNTARMRAMSSAEERWRASQASTCS